MQRKILLTPYRCLNTCLGGASWRRPLVNRLDREVECVRVWQQTPKSNQSGWPAWPTTLLRTDERSIRPECPCLACA